MARPAMRSASELLGLALAGVVPCLAYAALGLWMLRALRLPASGAERVALAFVLGSGAASLALLILLGFGAPVPLPALALVALAGVPALRTPPPDPTPASPAPRWSRWIDGATLALGLLLFLAALGPETYWDGFEYHLPIAKAWADGGIRALPGVLDAELRAGIDLLYVPALAAGEPDAAASVSACFALALAGLVRAEARRRASPGAGSLAAFFALVVPLTLENAPSSYVDLGAGAYGFLALLFADRWNRTGDARLIGATALCLAFAANAKLHLAVLVPAVLVLVLLGGRPPRAREIAVGAALVVALVTPWCVKEALTTGNPFFPFLGGRFGLGGYDARHLALRAVRLSTDFAQPRTAGTTLAYLASLVAGRNPHLSGLLGPLPFALAPLALRRPSRATLLLEIVLAALAWLHFVRMPALRFATPLLPFAAVAAAVGGVRLARSGRVAATTLALCLGVLALHHLAGFAQACLPRIAALRDPRAYEGRVFPDQAALRDAVSRAEPVVAIPKGAVAWMERPVYVLNWERNGELFFDRVLQYQTPPEAALALLVRRGVHSLVLDVAPPLPADGTLGHPSVDAWIRDGRARVRPDPQPKPARGGRVWVTVDLLREPVAAPPSR